MSEGTTNTITPKALAEELNIDAKRLRGWLRGSDFKRDPEAKNTTWAISPEAADAARAKFAAKATEEPATDEATEEVTEEADAA
jgi:hypothetical protein